jgi:putative salt-induced outer membrane protein YdiY
MLVQMRRVGITHNRGILFDVTRHFTMHRQSTPLPALLTSLLLLACAHSAQAEEVSPAPPAMAAAPETPPAAPLTTPESPTAQAVAPETPVAQAHATAVPPSELTASALADAVTAAAAAAVAAGAASVAAPTLILAARPVTPAVQAPPEPEPVLSGDISTAFARNRSSYTSYHLSTSLDLTYKLPGREVLTEARIDRESVRIPGSQETSVSSDEYDISVKWKNFRPGSSTYLYASPRLRYNRFSYYRNTEAIRLGVGRRIYSDDPITLDLEIGTGFRFAQPATGSAVRQTLNSVTTRFAYDFSKSLSMKINFSSEKAGLERYNNLVASLNTPLIGALGLKYEMSYRKIFPIDSGQLTTETSYNLALDYRI